MVKELIPECLRYMTLEQFWSYDFEEIRLLSDTYKHQKEDELKDKLILLYQEASMIATMVGCAFGEKKPPTIDKLYPSLFTANKNAIIENFESQMLEYAQAYNAKRASQEANK